MSRRDSPAAPAARWVQGILAFVALIALGASPRAAERWECAMSGERTCPCACSMHDEQADDDPSVHRQSCCKAEPSATVPSAIDAPSAPTVAAVTLGSNLSDGDDPIGRYRPHAARGPPPPRRPAYLRNHRLLL